MVMYTTIIWGAGNEYIYQSMQMERAATILLFSYKMVKYTLVVLVTLSLGIQQRKWLRTQELNLNMVPCINRERIIG